MLLSRSGAGIGEQTLCRGVQLTLGCPKSIACSGVRGSTYSDPQGHVGPSAVLTGATVTGDGYL